MQLTRAEREIMAATEALLDKTNEDAKPLLRGILNRLSASLVLDDLVTVIYATKKDPDAAMCRETEILWLKHGLSVAGKRVACNGRRSRAKR